MPEQDLKSCWAGRKFLPLQLRGYFRRLCIVIEKFLNGNWFYIAPLGYVGDQEKVSKTVLFGTLGNHTYGKTTMDEGILANTVAIQGGGSAP